MAARCGYWIWPTRSLRSTLSRYWRLEEEGFRDIAIDIRPGWFPFRLCAQVNVKALQDLQAVT